MDSYLFDLDYNSKTLVISIVLKTVINRTIYSILTFNNEDSQITSDCATALHIQVNTENIISP